MATRPCLECIGPMSPLGVVMPSGDWSHFPALSWRILHSPLASSNGGKEQVGCGRRPAGSCRAPETLPPSSQPLFRCTRGQGVHRMWLPVCPPPISVAHASACAQTSKNVKHVDARSGGGERCLSSGPLGSGLSFPGGLAGRATPGATPTLSPGVGRALERGSCNPSPILPRGCEGSCGKEGPSWIGRGASGQGPG